MKLDFAILADAAVAHADGRIYVMGGAFARIKLERPYRYPQLSIILRLKLTPEEASAPHEFELTLIHRKTKQVVIGPATLTSGVDDGDHANPAINVSVTAQQVEFKAAGDYEYQIKVDGKRVGKVDLEIVLDAGGEPPTSSGLS